MASLMRRREAIDTDGDRCVANTRLAWNVASLSPAQPGIAEIVEIAPAPRKTRDRTQRPYRAFSSRNQVRSSPGHRLSRR